jgi:hypothetical protein
MIARELCLTLAKRLLAALLLLALLLGPAAHAGEHALSAAPLAIPAFADADHDQGDGCAQEAAGLHGCAQPAETGEQPCPVIPLAGTPGLVPSRPLGSLDSSPALQPPILPASA